MSDDQKNTEADQNEQKIKKALAESAALEKYFQFLEESAKLMGEISPPEIKNPDKWKNFKL